MKKYSLLIQQYKTQDSKKELFDEQNESLQEAHCFDDDDCFDLGTVCDCTSASCAGTSAICDGCGSADCLDCNDKY